MRINRHRTSPYCSVANTEILADFRRPIMGILTNLTGSTPAARLIGGTWLNGKTGEPIIAENVAIATNAPPPATQSTPAPPSPLSKSRPRPRQLNPRQLNPRQLNPRQLLPRCRRNRRQRPPPARLLLSTNQPHQIPPRPLARPSRRTMNPASQHASRFAICSKKNLRQLNRLRKNRPWHRNCSARG